MSNVIDGRGSILSLEAKDRRAAIAAVLSKTTTFPHSPTPNPRIHFQAQQFPVNAALDLANDLVDLLRASSIEGFSVMVGNSGGVVTAAARPFGEAIHPAEVAEGYFSKVCLSDLHGSREVSVTINFRSELADRVKALSRELLAA